MRRGFQPLPFRSVQLPHRERAPDLPRGDQLRALSDRQLVALNEAVKSAVRRFRGDTRRDKGGKFFFIKGEGEAACAGTFCLGIADGQIVGMDIADALRQKKYAFSRMYPQVETSAGSSIGLEKKNPVPYSRCDTLSSSSNQRGSKR